MKQVKVQVARLTCYGVVYVAGTFAVILLIATFHLRAPGPTGLVPVWALLCGFAAYRQHLMIWAVLCLTPLAITSLNWLLMQGVDDPFGIRWATIELFTAASLVTAATGILTLIARPASRPLVWTKG